jgi:hypothetical protein
LLIDDEEARLLDDPFAFKDESALSSTKELRFTCSDFLLVDLPLELPGL